jgi:hypothetical protein
VFLGDAAREKKRSLRTGGLMSTERIALFDRLADLTGDLSPLPGTPPNELQRARSAVARAVAIDQPEPITG